MSGLARKWLSVSFPVYGLTNWGGDLTLGDWDEDPRQAGAWMVLLALEAPPAFAVVATARDITGATGPTGAMQLLARAGTALLSHSKGVDRGSGFAELDAAYAAVITNPPDWQNVEVDGAARRFARAKLSFGSLLYGGPATPIVIAHQGDAELDLHLDEVAFASYGRRGPKPAQE